MKKHSLIILLLTSILLSCNNTGKITDKENIFIEAESFAEKNGWVVDQQFMDVMGSPFLMAHGLGKPVEDAKTELSIPEKGNYHLWVRTRNWVANWDVSGAPGKFQVLVNGAPVDSLFGTKGKKWDWHYGGEITLERGKNILALHDMTGFNGRCDALFFTKNPELVPPSDVDSLYAFRKKMMNLPEKAPTAGKFDLVVVGGGVAGTTAAISAARLGLQVALIQDRPVLGGNNSSEVRVHLGGKTNLPPYPEIGDIVQEIGPERQGNARPAEYYEDEKKIRAVKQEKNITLFLNYHAFAVETENNLIKAVIAKNIETAKELRFEASLFSDCTGDGTIGYLAGADFRMGRESKEQTGESRAPEKADDMTMGASVQWYSHEAENPVDFPACPWAVDFREETAQKVKMGEWDWETGMNKDQIFEFEEIRDYGLRVIYGNWAFLKNEYSKKEEYVNRELDWVAYIAGKRESRRLMGDVILKEQDILERRKFPDASVVTTWSIDLHYPDSLNSKQFPGREFRSIAIHTHIKPYAIPYRTLYSRNINNLFMAGRNISVTHVALGTIRVMRTTGMMGEVVGMAAKVCIENDALPREVYSNHLNELKTLMQQGVGKDNIPKQKEG